MPDDTPLLSLPLLQPAQAQKHVTHNEALRLLDLLTQLAVADRSRTTPPPLPAEGDRHLVAAPASGAWQGQEGRIAAFWDGTWVFLAPRPGWQLWVVAENTALAFNGTGWVAPAQTPETLPRLGISATADTVNRLAVASPATLFDHAGQGHQLKINKSAPSQTGSLLFQTAYSGRAEMGLAGSDAFAIRVSANGTTFTTALSVDPATGQTSFPAPAILSPLAADPASPGNGTIWHHGSDAHLRARLGGRSVILDGQQCVPCLVPPAGELVQSTVGTGGAATVNVAGAANRIDIFPFLPRADLGVDALLLNCTTAQPGAQARLLVYAADAQGRPAARLHQTGLIDLSDTGAKTAALTLTLPQGVTVWLGLHHSANATVSAWPGSASPDLNGGTLPATTARKALRRFVDFADGGPATWGFSSSEIVGGNVPAIWLRMA